MGFGFVIARFGLFLREIASQSARSSAASFSNGGKHVHRNRPHGVGDCGSTYCRLESPAPWTDCIVASWCFPPRWSLSVIVCLLLAAIGLGLTIYLALV